MRCGCSRDVVGILMGCFLFMGSLLILIIRMIMLLERNYHNGSFLQRDEIESFLFLVMITVISYLYIVAIEERRLYLIFPWQFLSLYLLLITLSLLGYGELGFLIYHPNALTIFVLVIYLSMLAFEIIAVWNSVLVFKKIYNENIAEYEGENEEQNATLV